MVDDDSPAGPGVRIQLTTGRRAPATNPDTNPSPSGRNDNSSEVNPVAATAAVGSSRGTGAGAGATVPEIGSTSVSTEEALASFIPSPGEGSNVSSRDTPEAAPEHQSSIKIEQPAGAAALPEGTPTSTSRSGASSIGHSMESSRRSNGENYASLSAPMPTPTVLDGTTPVPPLPPRRVSKRRWGSEGSTPTSQREGGAAGTQSDATAARTGSGSGSRLMVGPRSRLGTQQAN
ncbi:unnamed protein product, partial [Choristocarpus tenellus]